MNEDIRPVPKPIPSLPKRRAFNSTLPAPEWPTFDRNKERQEREFLRCYGSEERVEWVNSFGCVICGTHMTRRENVHVRGGGAGRKADARFIVPMCRPHHRELHREGVDTFSASYSIDLEATADQFEARWQAYSGTLAAGLGAKSDG